MAVASNRRRWGLRVATDPTFGGGHIARALAVADALAAGDGHGVLVFTDPANPAPDRLVAAGHECRPDTDPGATDAVADARGAGAISALLCDSYAVTETAIEPLAAHIPVARFRDDDVRGTEHVAIDINPGATPRPDVIAGPEFAPIGLRYRQARAGAKRKNPVDHELRILIAFGLRDSSGMALAVLEALLARRNSAAITIAASRQSPTWSTLQALAKRSPSADVVTDPSDLAKLYGDADVAVGAPGSSQFERACCGLPTVLLPQNQLQRPLAEAWHATGAAVCADGPEAAVDSLLGLLNDPTARSEMSKCAASLVDGHGATRLAAALNEQIAVIAA